MIKKTKLFDQFPPVTKKEWLDKINRDLQGEDFNTRLVWKTREGFEIMPFYCREDIDNQEYINKHPGEFPYLPSAKGDNNKWKIRQNIVVTDYKKANDKALELLDKGVDSLGFIIADPESVSEDNINTLLRNISPAYVEINFFSDGKAKEITEYFLSYIEKTFTDPRRVSGAVETDPLSRLMLNGTLCIPVDKGFDYLAGVTTMLAPLPNFRVVHINASNFGNAGATLTQELAFAISMGTEYMLQLTDRGISAKEAASRIRFSFGTGSEYFPEIAKLRAARLLWSAVMNRFIPGDHEAAKMEVHCVTTRWNKTVFDSHINIIRTQTEAMAAVIGGTDSLTVEPFDIVYRKPDSFSERIARNQQLLLKEESFFDRVADPAGGSYYIENLTRIMAEEAWKLFLETESKGGFLESLKQGFIQKKTDESASKLKNDILNGKLNFTGTTIFTIPGEKIPAGVKNENNTAGLSQEEDQIVNPLQLFRGPSLFEEKRMTTTTKSKTP